METPLGFELISLFQCRHRERDRAMEPKFMISKGPFWPAFRDAALLVYQTPMKNAGVVLHCPGKRDPWFATFLG